MEEQKGQTLVALILAAGTPRSSSASEEASSAGSEPLPANASPFPLSPPATSPSPSDPSVFSYDWASDVPCNLRVKEYWTLINQRRAPAFRQIAQQIQTGNYDTLNMNLNVAPMADLRQAVLYLPWALLQNSEYTATTDSFKAHKVFDDHVKDLQRAATAASVYGTGEGPAQAQQQAQQVQQAFILMSASLDGFLAAVPAKYGNGSLFQQAS
ncbi:hypothetical protein TSOC_006103 [Tetrabaena socialis]|uniref:Uncharacterized protein n=1 Tax=Tetrabaena socialis TaxID=47790 RepID=A0A2J8A4H6_9CHLO|nr:hypothetical protein TSOC_006103 [Tetrabaena socialis]|eukprot:PNH07431.1 hypothetical protein TSOC_006103 [Tetrabaena socialis]